MLKGTFTAMITPFKNGEVDYDGLVQNIHEQLSSGVEGLLFLGTTGESPTLTLDEQKKIVEIAAREVKNNALLLVGSGTNCTRTTIEKTKCFQKMGADIALIISPYYNKPSQEGLFRHFETLSKEVSLPLLAYNHLGRTGVQLKPETLLKIAKLPHLIGLKETSSDLSFLKELHALLKDQAPSFSLLSGCDENTLEMIKMGYHGVISVISNLCPVETKAIVDLALKEQYNEAQLRHDQLLPLMELACIETNPVPIKAALNFFSKPAGNCRLPLCELSKEHQEKLELFLHNWELKALCKN